jgi:hypothetical protein
MADRMEYEITDQDGGLVATAVGRVNAQYAMRTLLEEGSFTRLTATGTLIGCDEVERVIHHVEAHRLPDGAVSWQYPDGRAW